MFFRIFWGVESVAKVFGWKYGLVYYIFGCFGGKNGLKMGFLVQTSEFLADCGACGVVFDIVLGVECSERVFEWKYGLVYYILGCFGAENGLKQAQMAQKWSKMKVAQIGRKFVFYKDLDEWNTVI